MKSSNFGYLGAIDQIRGIAALWITAYHYNIFISHYLVLNRTYSSLTPASDYWFWSNNPLYSILATGHTAVSLFMVLSGFIFTYGAGDRTLQYSGFLKNRILRVYPLWIVLVLFGIASTKSSVDFLTLIEALLPVGLRSSPLPWTPFTAMHWSLVIECQFYLIFPLLIVAARRIGMVRFVCIVIGALFLLRFFAIGLGADSYSLVYYGLAGRLDQFLIGMLLAYLYSLGYPSMKVAKLCFPLLLLVILALMMYVTKLGIASAQGWAQSLRMTLEGTLWALVIGCYLKLAQYLPRWIATGLEKVGEMSFSVYMLHMVVIWAFVISNPWMRVGLGVSTDLLINFCLLVLPAVLFTGYVSFNAFEKPFLALRVQYLKPKNIAPE